MGDVCSFVWASCVEDETTAHLGLQKKKKKKKKTRLKSEYQAQTDNIKKVSTYAQAVAVEQVLTPQLPCL